MVSRPNHSFRVTGLLLFLLETLTIMSKNIKYRLKKVSELKQHADSIQKWASHVAQSGKKSAYGAGDPGLIPGSGRSPGEENGNPLQDSCLEKPTDSGAWQATVHGVARVGHNLAAKLWMAKPPSIQKYQLTFTECVLSMRDSP